MKKIALTLSVALASLLATTAFAQSKGEADPAQSKAIPAKAATADEKAEAKIKRKAEGSAAAKSGAESEKPASAGTAKVASKEEKKQAAIKRKAAAKDAVKKGETTSGEK